MNLINRPTWIALALIIKILYTKAVTDIPDFLSECYEIDWEDSDQYQQLPMTMPVLIDIIRTLEDRPGIPHNIEDTSSILINMFGFDGQSNANEYDSRTSELNVFLSLEEKCYLHFMMSNNDTSRDDENIICSKLKGLPKESEEDFSPCSVESGVISTEFGPITTAYVIAGIVAGLQFKEKAKEVNDILRHIRTILDEELMTVSGTFDDQFFPRYYIISDKEEKQLTEARINGEIDGLILAANVAKWRRQFKNLKLSQSLEMYYSRRGVFDRKMYAGNRLKLLSGILRRYKDNHSSLGETLYQRDLSSRLTFDSEIIEKEHINQKDLNFPNNSNPLQHVLLWTLISIANIVYYGMDYKLY